MKTLIEFVRRNWLFFLLATLAGLALRLIFVFRFPHVAGDTLVYGDIAKNWMDHGVFGLTDNGLVRPTLIRLPGYPAFLVVMFKIFGREHYTAVMVMQALIDLNSCLVIAALALTLMNERAAKAAYLLAALCPFTANYVAAPLSETLSIFCLAHAFYYGVRGLKELEQENAQWHLWIVTGLWSAAAIFMRPDNGLVLAALGLALLILFFRKSNKRQVLIAGVLLAVVSLGPLTPWAVRNWRVFHLWQPLASRYANDPGEFVPHGFDHWVKTWMADYVSVEDVYWHVSGEAVDPENLPERAFDGLPQYQKTLDLIARYNDQLSVDADLDAEFDAIARSRVEYNPMRYTIWLPFLRTADMWLRPRTEILYVDTRWWNFSEHRKESAFAVFWAALNLFFLLACFRGWMQWKLGLAGIFVVSFILLRSMFLSSLENPEPRYMLECFPIVLALAGGAFAKSPAKIKAAAEHTS
jgi:Dolichyl-phosphate-mannose-protein mannosyltransferase